MWLALLSTPMQSGKYQLEIAHIFDQSTVLESICIGHSSYSLQVPLSQLVVIDIVTPVACASQYICSCSFCWDNASVFFYEQIGFRIYSKWSAQQASTHTQVCNTVLVWGSLWFVPIKSASLLTWQTLIHCGSAWVSHVTVMCRRQWMIGKDMAI